MQKITQQELLAIARMSRLQLDEQEIASLLSQVDIILNYAHRVKDAVELQSEPDLAAQKNANVFRPDFVIKTDRDPILAQAPESEQGYFVVPVILETT